MVESSSKNAYCPLSRDCVWNELPASSIKHKTLTPSGFEVQVVALFDEPGQLLELPNLNFPGFSSQVFHERLAVVAHQAITLENEGISRYIWAISPAEATELALNATKQSETLHRKQ